MKEEEIRIWHARNFTYVRPSYSRDKLPFVEQRSRRLFKAEPIAGRCVVEQREDVSSAIATHFAVPMRGQ